MHKNILTDSAAWCLDIFFLPNGRIFDRNVPIPAQYHEKNVHICGFLCPMFRFVVGWQTLQAVAIIIAAKDGVRREKSQYGDGWLC